MKRSIHLFLAICTLVLLCALTGCKKDDRFQTTFPLEEDVVTAALEQVGLPGAISESETTSAREWHVMYTIRSRTETFDGSDNPLFLAGITSANYEGERMLYAQFNQRIASSQIVWEDWKKQIVFATLLYGGFENEKDVYQAFVGKELPEGEDSGAWDAALSGGYCRVTYSARSNTTYDENGFAIKNQSAFLSVNIYESEALYQKLKPKQ